MARVSGLTILGSGYKHPEKKICLRCEKKVDGKNFCFVFPKYLFPVKRYKKKNGKNNYLPPSDLGCANGTLIPSLRIFLSIFFSTAPIEGRAPLPTKLGFIDEWKKFCFVFSSVWQISYV
jgi:hypothetical protein